VICAVLQLVISKTCLADAEQAGAADRLQLARSEPADPQEVARDRQLAALRMRSGPRDRRTAVSLDCKQ